MANHKDAAKRAGQAIKRRARNRDVPARGPVLRPARPGESQLGALGFAYVVLHEDELSPQEWARSQRTAASRRCTESSSTNAR